jgi:cell division protein FtsB
VTRAETAAAGRLLDRLIRSRIWIGLVAFALIGIVAMQLWLLKLNGGIGRAIEHEAFLQRENAALSAENSGMSAGDLVERRAFAQGMTVLAPGSLVFMHTRGALDERLAAARLAQPVAPPTEASSSGTTGQTPTETSTTTTAQPEPQG